MDTSRWAIIDSVTDRFNNPWCTIVRQRPPMLGCDFLSGDTHFSLLPNLERKPVLSVDLFLAGRWADFDLVRIRPFWRALVSDTTAQISISRAEASTSGGIGRAWVGGLSVS
jgi:hypothetical protein